MAKNSSLSQILKKLLFERDMKPMDLAREVNIPQPTIHRLIAGKSTRPYRSSLQPIADYFSVTVEQLLGEVPFSDKNLQKDLNSSQLITKNRLITIPLVPWKSLYELEHAMASCQEEITVTYYVSNRSFALITQDSSMEPLFPRGSILIFDPKISAVDRSYVLVKFNATNTFVFRQLLVDLEYKYIKSLNPDLSASKMHLLTAEDEIVACLIESRNNYSPNNTNN